MLNLKRAPALFPTLTSYGEGPGLACPTEIVRRRCTWSVAGLCCDQEPVIWRMAWWKEKPSTRMKKSMVLPSTSRWEVRMESPF